MNNKHYQDIMEEMERALNGHYFRLVDNKGNHNWYACTGISEAAEEFLASY